MSIETPIRRPLNRRRFITIAAAAAAGAYAVPRRRLADDAQAFTWRGVALGAQTSLTLEHTDPVAARLAIEACLTEVARLEAVFSLHRPESALTRLNAEGRLVAAPTDLRLLLAEALSLAKRSDGAFDPSIQPLWTLYADHFGRPNADPRGPTPQEIAQARLLVDWRRVAIDDIEIRLTEPGMAITLNGIAQGYITDKVGDLLRARGFEHVLVNLGEQLAIGPKWSGEAWTIGISDPARPDRLIDTIGLSHGAVATSAGAGFTFDASRRFTHILDPRTGRPATGTAETYSGCA